MFAYTRGISWKGAGRLAGILVIGLCGCKPGVGTVSGKVTYQDKPLPSGTVTFFAANNAVISAMVQADGSYTAEKVPEGAVKVTVTTRQPVAARPPATRRIVRPVTDPTFNRDMIPKRTPKPTVGIPRRYADPEQSGLSLTVTRKDTQMFDISLHD